MTRTVSSLSRAMVLLLLIAITLLAMTGCSLFGGAPADVTVTDPTGSFQFKIPGTWLARSTQGMINVYASENLPTTDAIETLSMVVMSARLDPEAEIPTPQDALDLFLDWRSEDRGWTDVEYSEFEDVKVGGRSAVRKTVTAKDSRGTAFKGQYYLVRPTATTEVLIMAVAPADTWDDTADDLNTILTEQWFWLGALGAPEATATVEPTATP